MKERESGEEEEGGRRRRKRREEIRIRKRETKKSEK